MFADGQEFTLDGKRNDGGFLATLHTQVTASNPFDAETKVYRAIAPYLSTVSTNLDVPLVVWRLLVIEVASGARFMRRRAPSLYAPFHAVPQVNMSSDFRALASLYREAIVSNSPAYEYLCLFKVAEAIVKRREVKGKALAAEGKRPERPITERIPSEPNEMIAWLRSVYILERRWDSKALEGVFPLKSRGRKIRDVLDSDLRKLRDRVAHGLLDEDVEISALADRSLFLDEVQEWIPLLRSIVRVMLKNDYPDEFLPTLRQDGTIDAAKAIQLSKVTEVLRSRGIQVDDRT